MKTAIVLPGRPHQVSEPQYQSIVQSFEANGFRTIAHQPDWSKKNVRVWVKDLLASVPDDSTELTLFGFSIGAFVALLAADKVNTTNLILCSPSGYFKEYIPLLTADDLADAQENIQGFETLSTKTLIPKLQVEHGFILAGSKELKAWDDFRQWVGDLESQTGWQKIIIEGVEHEIESPAYQVAVKKLIEGL